jgi:ubiquinone/menaquinone biosynthesis C-methylase UbiE
MSEKKSFVDHYFEGKTGDVLRKTITPDWNSTSGHLKLLNIDTSVGSIAEIGCGIGRLLKELNTSISKCVGFDASSAMIREGKEYCESTNIELIKVDGKGELPYESNSFDYVFSFITFQHIPNTNTVLKYVAEMYRLLKDTGTIKIQLLKNDEFPERDLWSHHDPSTIEKHLYDLGMTTSNIQDCGRWVIIESHK